MDSPNFLYKYRPIYTEQQKSFVKDVILEDKFFFAPPAFFFDPFEFRFSVSQDDSLEDKIEWLANKLCLENMNLELGEALINAKKILEQSNNKLTYHGLKFASDFMLPHINKRVGILSLSETPEDMLMWSYYADWHRGVCMGFEYSGECSFFGKAEKVVYISDYPNLGMLKKYSLQDGLSSRFYKSERWAHEKEWRIVESGAGEEYRKFPPQKLKQIILGCKIDINIAEEIKKWISERKYPVRMMQAKVTDKNYHLILEEV